MTKAIAGLQHLAGLRQSLSDLNFEIELAEDRIPGGPAHAQRLDSLYRERRRVFRSINAAMGV